MRHSSRVIAHVQKQFHNLCAGWRDRFVASGRHEVADVGDIALVAIRLCNFEHMHRMMKNPGCRTVAFGATVNPAWFREMRIFDDHCLWCNQSMPWGTWRGVTRALRRALVRPPSCSILRWWGWGSKV